jgi:hypothetical protein
MEKVIFVNTENVTSIFDDSFRNDSLKNVEMINKHINHVKCQIDIF